MEKYVLKTCLIENPKVVLYYKGTADESGVQSPKN